MAEYFSTGNHIRRICNLPDNECSETWQV